MTGVLATDTVAARLLAEVARRIGASLRLEDTLEAVAQAVVDALGFRVAVVNLVTEKGDLQVVAVAGGADVVDEVRTLLLGRRESRATWDALLEAAERWGDLRFVDHRAGKPAGTEDMLEYVPEDLGSTGEDAWHREDALFAPFVDGHGQLIGVLSVDIPDDGQRPSLERRELLEAFAVQASLAIEHARIHTALNDSEAMFRRTFDESPIGMALYGTDGRLARANRAYCQFLGRSLDELVGHTSDEFTHPDDREMTLVLAQQLRRGERNVFGLEKRYVAGDGRVVWGRLSCSRFEAKGGVLVLAQLEDVTDRKAAEAELEHRALHDPLTGLANRTLLMDRLAGALTRSRRDGQPVAVAFCDLDHFKLINDAHGHLVGDQMLLAVTRRLQESLRDTDTAARLGGDEFVVVCEGLPDLDHVRALAERIRAAVRCAEVPTPDPVSPSVSIGIALSGPDSTPDGLLAESDAALYQAKARGRDRWELFDVEMQRSLTGRLAMHADLVRAVIDRQFELHYQPIVDLHSGSAVGHEALLRWNHPRRGLLYPAEFLPAVEERGLDERITDWVLDRACLDAAGWLHRGRPWFVSVNVSPRELEGRALPERVEAALCRSGLMAGQLWLEVIEDRLLLQTHMETIERLRDLGVHVALDDFGTGYAGLNCLQRVAADVLKIDREFVTKLGVDRVSAGIAAAIVDLARVLDLTVVAEGVETPEQANHLRSLGVRYAQGYLYGRPAAGPPRPPLQRRSGAGRRQRKPAH